MATNKQIHLVSRPKGEASVDNFRLVEAPVPALREGQVLVRHHFLSLDPYMRGRMNDSKSYAAPQALDDVMIGGTVGEVVESRHEGFKPGDQVIGMGGWQQYSVVDPSHAGMLRKVDTSHVPLSAYLGAVGMPGVTAWYGLVKICEPKAGETVVVSAAAGAVGSVVGQLAKIAGCRAVGVAGGPAKCEHVVRDLGFDACIDYKAGQLERELATACAKGIDVYFDNVGGPTLDAVLPLTHVHARIVVCGMISQYSATEPYALKNLRWVLVNRIRMQGMIVFDWKARYGEAVAALGAYFAEGKLKYRVDVVEGLEHTPAALNKLFDGSNQGKLIVKVSDEPA